MSQQDKRVISQQLIFLDSPLSTQEDVITFIINQAYQAGYVNNQEELRLAVEEREAEIPTAIGYQIAMPHGKSVAVSRPFIAFLRTVTSFQWTPQSTEQVRLIFLIGIPQENAEKLHLKFISQLSKKLLDEDFRTQLLDQIDPNQLFKQLNLVDI